jgi:hypothetical protein
MYVFNMVTRGEMTGLCLTTRKVCIYNDDYDDAHLYNLQSRVYICMYLSSDEKRNDWSMFDHHKGKL